MQALYRYLVEGTAPPEQIKVVPHIVMRSNLDMLLERLPAGTKVHLGLDIPKASLFDAKTEQRI